ncbi:MAG TPA: redoxin domain-containing protein [Solirubrobacteraceae bacterium]|nr:redoxin domain-containing protein [Solirubrobacteraceae bacterium]
MRAPVDHIAAPPFPAKLKWANVATLRMDQQRGRPVLIEFWDFCRPNSMRTLPYMRALHERYEPAGLRVVGVHSPGFEPARDPAAVRAAVARLGVPYAVAIDSELEVWRLYDNLGWPARYLFNQEGYLFDYHYGEGGYRETELAIQELLGIERPTLEPVRPEDEPGAALVPQSEDVAGPYSGPYRAGGVWAVLGGRGWVSAGGERQAVEHPGAYELIRHERSTDGMLELELAEGVRCLAVCFTPGLA